VAYEDQTITISMDELSTRLYHAFGTWLVYHRGPEGFAIDDLVAAVNRLPSCRWLSMYVVDRETAVAALLSGQLDPKESE